MRQKLTTLAGILFLAVIIGCATNQSATAYKTLAAVQTTTAGAYSAYLNLVVTGQLKTNSVPTVSRDYTMFLAVWNAAVSVAASGTNAVATDVVANAAGAVISDISLAKGGSL